MRRARWSLLVGTLVAMLLGTASLAEAQSCTASFNPDTGPAGAPTTFRWTSSGDADGRLPIACSNGMTGVLPSRNGTLTVPIPDESLTCTATVRTWWWRSATCEATVTALAAPPPPPDPDPDPDPPPPPPPPPPPSGSWVPPLGIPHPGDWFLATEGTVQLVTAGGSSRTFTGTGTPTAPVIFRGVNAPRFTGVVTISGSYVIVEGINADGGGVNLSGSHVALRDSEVQRVNNRGTATFVNGGSDVVIFRNRIHDNGVIGNTENDRHGIGGGGFRIWILENALARNSGDSIQFGHQARNQFGTIYIGRNTMTGDRENAVDIKEASNVVISQNTMSGYRASSSSGGEAVVVHDCPINAHVIFNTIRDSEVGILVPSVSSTCPTPVNVRLIGNVIEGVNAGIAGWNSGKNVAIVGNTIVGANYGISVSHLTSASVVENNLLWRISGTVISAAGATVRNNLADTVNPLFVDDLGGDYRLLDGSPAIDTGRATPAAYGAHLSLYGVAILVDHAGVARPQGSAWDIGAHEFQDP